MQSSSEIDKSITEESFLDVTVKSKGTSTRVKKVKGEEVPEETKSKHEAVCSHYLKGRCKHGRIGKDCSWQHPKLCFAFTKSGECKKESCEYFHPNLCRHSVKKEVCENESKCKFFHTKICRKRKEVGDDRKKEEDIEKDIREKIVK